MWRDAKNVTIDCHSFCHANGCIHVNMIISTPTITSAILLSCTDSSHKLRGIIIELYDLGLLFE